MDIVERGLRSLPRFAGNLPFTNVNPSELAEDVFRSNPRSFRTKADAYMATMHFFEFIYLKRLYSDEDGKLFAPTATDDLVWRTALLNTRYYQQVCGDRASFLHRIANAPQDDANAKRMERTRVAYQMEFNRPLEAPIVEGDDCERDSDEDEEEDEDDDEDEVLLHRGVPFVVGDDESSSSSAWSESVTFSSSSDVESEVSTPSKKREREHDVAEPVVIATLPIVKL